jgi:hypothetical protein
MGSQELTEMALGLVLNRIEEAKGMKQRMGEQPGPGAQRKKRPGIKLTSFCREAQNCRGLGVQEK